MRRPIGVSTLPLVGSIYNMGVWDKVAAAWVNVATRRTLDREEAARGRYQETGRSLENGGCIGDPHIVVDRCVVFLCILHCCMAIGRLQVAFIKTRLVDLPKENTDAVQRVLYWARTGVKLGASMAPDGEEARALFLAWEELGPLLDYVPEDGEWQAAWPCVTSSGSCTRTSRPAGTYVRPRCHTPTVHIVARRRANQTTSSIWRRMSPRPWPMHAAWGLGWVPCARMLLRASTPSLSAHAVTARAARGGGGMPGATQLEREGEVVDLPLRNYGTPHTAPCTMAKLMANRSPPPSTLASPPPALFSPCHGRLGNAKDVGRRVQSQQCSPGVFCLCTLGCVFRLIFAASCLIFRD